MTNHSHQLIAAIAAVGLMGLLICGCGGDGAPPTGQVEGTVLNANTGGGVYPATVTIGGVSAATQTDGSYSTQVPIGTHSLTVTAAGFQSFPMPGQPPYNISVTTGVNLIPNILLVPTGSMPPPPPP